MKRINVIDLDNTLLPYDSFRLFVKREISKIDFFVIAVTIFRVTRIINSTKYKKLLISYWNKKYPQEFFKQFAKTLYNDLNIEVFKVISEKSSDRDLNILLSASPNLYVQHLLQLLKWEGSGSYFEDKIFINLYGQEKINWLKKNYPPIDFMYSFSISDSQSDNKMLSMFSESILLKN